MVKTDGKNKAEMLAFDQGLSFPNSNRNYASYDFGNQYDFLMGAGKKEFTPDFIENFGKFLTSGDFEQFHRYVNENIGTKEAESFKERVGYFAEQIFKNKKTSLSDMNFRKHGWTL